MVQLIRRNQNFYNNCWPDWLDMKIYGPASRWLRFLISKILYNLNPTIVTSILDVGCGNGTITFETLVPAFPKARIMGIDISETAINAAKHKYYSNNLTFIHDGESTALNNEYSLVTCFEVLEHVEDWQILLKKMAISSKHYLIISVPVGKMRACEKNVGHLRNYKKGQIENFLVSMNFKPIECFYAGFPFYSPTYRDICNITKSAKDFTKGSYGLKQKFIAHILFFIFKYFSSTKNHGDQFVGLFERFE